jgi:uncharacterized protein
VSSLLYLDSSAIIKIVVSEAESGALMSLLADWPLRISSELAQPEVLRSLRRGKVSVREFRRGEKVLAHINLIRIDKRILRDAAMLPPPSLRTLDAIHLATALSVRADLAAVVTYDSRLAKASSDKKLTVWSPR